jgi:hypothetical protein
MDLSMASASTIKTYEALYEAEPNASNVEAPEALFQGDGKELRRQQRKCKPPP